MAMSDEAISKRVNARVEKYAATLSDAELNDALDRVERAAATLRSSRSQRERQQAVALSDEIEILRLEQARRRPN
jgi:uncharacterized protein YdcH (DUF465 family)